MSWATLGFSRVTHTHTCQNPYLHPKGWVFVHTGQGFTKTHRYPNLHGVTPSEMTSEPCKGSASVNGCCHVVFSSPVKSSFFPSKRGNWQPQLVVWSFAVGFSSISVFFPVQQTGPANTMYYSDSMNCVFIILCFTDILPCTHVLICCSFWRSYQCPPYSCWIPVVMVLITY